MDASKHLPCDTNQCPTQEHKKDATPLEDIRPRWEALTRPSVRISRAQRSPHPRILKDAITWLCWCNCAPRAEAEPLLTHASGGNGPSRDGRNDDASRRLGDVPSHVEVLALIKVKRSAADSSSTSSSWKLAAQRLTGQD